MTNGEKIIEIVGGKKPFIDTFSNPYMIFNKDWWNAEYNEPTTKNNLGVSSGLEKNSQKLEKDFGELDCISRADAIRVASGYCHPSNVAKELAKLPPVTPQPKTGHWIPTYGNVECSVCGSVKDSRNVGRATHYCDFCGAKMEGKI